MLAHGEQPVHVMIEGDISGEQNDGIARRRCHAERAAGVAVDAARAPVGVNVERPGARPGELIDVADGQATADEKAAVRGQEAHQIDYVGAVELAVGHRLTHHLPVKPLGGLELRRPAPRPAPRAHLRQDRAAGCRLAGLQEERRAVAVVGPDAALAHVDAMFGADAFQISVQRAGGGHSAEAQHQLRLGPARLIGHQVCLVAAEHRRLGHPRPEAQAREGVGKDGIAGIAGKRRHRLGKAVVLLPARPHDDDAARVVGHHAAQQRGLRLGRQELPAGDLQGRRGRFLASGWLLVQRLERLAEGRVQVDRSRRQSPGRGCRARDQRLEVAQRQLRRLRFRQRQVHRPEYLVAIQLHLVDGLVRAAVAQLRRAVGGDHQQRHPGHARLDDGREEVGRRRAARRQQGGRPVGCLADAQREIGGAALVQVAPDAQHRMGGKGQHERRRARAGRQANVLHAGSRQRLGDGAGPYGRRIGARAGVHGFPPPPAPPASAGTSTPSPPTPCPARSRRRCPPRRRARRAAPGQ